MSDMENLKRNEKLQLKAIVKYRNRSRGDQTNKQKQKQMQMQTNKKSKTLFFKVFAAIYKMY